MNQCATLINRYDPRVSHQRHRALLHFHRCLMALQTTHKMHQTNTTGKVHKGRNENVNFRHITACHINYRMKWCKCRVYNTWLYTDRFVPRRRKSESLCSAIRNGPFGWEFQLKNVMKLLDFEFGRVFRVHSIVELLKS